MRTAKAAVLMAVASMLAASPAWAQQATTLRVRQSAAAQQIGYAYDYYEEDLDEGSPSDQPFAGSLDETPATDLDGEDSSSELSGGEAGCDAKSSCDCNNACDSNCDSGCDTGCDSGCQGDCGCDSCCQDGCGCECDLGEPSKLFDCCWLEEHDLTVAGWLDQGYTWNPDSPDNRFNGPQTFNDRSNEYQMNQLYLYVEKPTDTEGCGFDLGGRFDLLYGTDHRFTMSRGLEVEQDFEDKWNSGQRFYGLAMPQAYAEVAYNDLKVKLGHFYTPVGYEAVTSTSNFFYSHTYTHQYGEPFTHTGALATYALNEQLSLTGGVTRGWDAWEDNNDDLAGLFGFSLTSEDKKASLAWYAHIGAEDDAGEQNRFYNSYVFTYALTDDWKYVFHHDYGIQEDSAGAGQDGEWYAFVHYLQYTVNDCLSWGLRYEWFSDDDGTRVAQLLPDDAHTLPIAGVPTHWQDITLGLNYKPHANVVIRPEARFDWADPLVDDPDYSVGPENGEGPYDDFSDRSQFTLGTDVIVTY